ncbi:MAG TPA: oligopeptide transporter, OPT family [Pirellulaceae bacterium]|jgi:putative OPT family oligopeptide transporter
MAKTPLPADKSAVVHHEPFVAPSTTNMPEFTWPAVLTGTILGIIFSASSMYLVLKVGMTVSASIPIAVLSISLFRAFSAITRMRRATILENNMVQTTGSAGESIAFGVGVTMPALMLLGFEMDLYRTMTVAVLGGLLGILMMIPLRRAFIVKQHGILAYPEGTACADVLTAGEKGGASAVMVFLGFFVAATIKFLMSPLQIIHDVANWDLFRRIPVHNEAGQLLGHRTVGLHKGVLGGEFTPELIGVGYIIGPRIACITVAGGIVAYLVLLPAIAMFGEYVSVPIFPSTTALIHDMTPSAIRNFYILYIGAGAVATGGIISMAKAMPVIIASLVAGVKDMAGMFGVKSAQSTTAVPRTERDLSMGVVFIGCLVLILLLALSPNLGLGLSWHGLLGAFLVVIFGFLFVTVSSRLTGEIGSSSNPISGMTVATLLLTCLIFLALGKVSKSDTLTALTIAGVVCIAASNGGTTAQDLKTGFLVGATPKSQQIGILIGALTSALVIGATVKLVNDAGTHYTKNPAYLPTYVVPAEQVPKLTAKQTVGRPYAGEDKTEYHILHVAEGEIPGVQQGKYLADDNGVIRYREDPAINGLLAYNDLEEAKRSRGEQAVPVQRYDAPKTKLMALIIDGILNQKLPWSLVLIGALLAISLELCMVPSLPFAVGIYLPLQTSFPIFCGGVIRWIVDWINPSRSEESESSPGVLLSSGYIAGGSLIGVLAAFLNFKEDWLQTLNLRETFQRLVMSPEQLEILKNPAAAVPEQLAAVQHRMHFIDTSVTMTAFAIMVILLLAVGSASRFKRKAKPAVVAPAVKK